MKSAFYPFDDRLALIEGRIKPGFAALDPMPVRRRLGPVRNLRPAADERLIY